MKIPNRLKLIWCALWYGRIRFSMTMVGRDQTKGYMQRWVFHVEEPGENFRVLRAADMVAGQAPVGMHYEGMLADDLESLERTPVDPDIIDAVRDSPANLDDPDGPTLREVQPPGSLHYLPHENMTREERDAVILKDWHKRHPK